MMQRSVICKLGSSVHSSVPMKDKTLSRSFVLIKTQVELESTIYRFVLLCVTSKIIGRNRGHGFESCSGFSNTNYLE